MPKRIFAPYPRLTPLVFVGYLLSIALIGCGQTRTPVTPTPRSTAAKVARPTTTGHEDLTSLLKLNPQMSADVPGKVHVQLSGVQVDQNPDGGTISKASDPLPGGIDCGSVLVLSSPTLSYSAAQLQHMRTYVGATFGNIVTSGDSGGQWPSPPENPDAVPSELRWVQGVPGTSCVGDMEITNIGDTPLQILGAGVDLAEDPVSNNYAYHLIEKCSLLGGCTFSAFGGGPACVFNVDIQLGLGTSGSTYQGQLTSNGAEDSGPCLAPITVEPQHVVDIILRFTLTPQAATGMVFRVRPYLSIDSQGATAKVALPTLTSTVAFARKSQYGCYDLQGNNFTLDTGFDPSQAFVPSGDRTALCV